MVQASNLVSLTVTLSKKKKAVDAASLEVWTVARVKKKWFDIKVNAKKRILEIPPEKNWWRTRSATQGEVTGQGERLAAVSFLFLFPSHFIVFLTLNMKKKIKFLKYFLHLI